MTTSTLYDDDILLWSEQQAEMIRGLAARVRGLPNDFDVENVAEEIESVGRSELASVDSFLRNVLVHLIKIANEPHSDAVRHWQSEVVNFQVEAQNRYAPSMAQRIDVQAIWKQALRIATHRQPEQSPAAFPFACPLTLEQLLVEDSDPAALARVLQASAIVEQSQAVL